MNKKALELIESEQHDWMRDFAEENQIPLYTVIGTGPDEESIELNSSAIGMSIETATAIIVNLISDIVEHTEYDHADVINVVTHLALKNHMDNA